MRTSPATSPSPLTLLRRLWFGVALGLLAVTTLVLVAASPEATVPAVLPLSLTAAAGAAAVVGAVAVDRFFAATPPQDETAALAELRQRAYLTIGIAEAPVLLGVAIAFVLGPRWTAVVGAIGGLAVLAVARPTEARLRRIEAVWQRDGHDVSLVRAVRGETTRDGPDGP